MLRLRGLVIAVVIITVAVLLSSYARGSFADRFGLTIDAATLGEGLAPGSPCVNSSGVTMLTRLSVH